MISATVEKLVDSAMALLSQRGDISSVDGILDLILEAASQCGRLEAMCGEDKSLQFKTGENDRKCYQFGNCGAKFRALLGELYFRCEKSIPRRLTGTVYGFEADVFLRCAKNEDVHFFIRTSNTQSFPELFIETLA